MTAFIKIPNIYLKRITSLVLAIVLCSLFVLPAKAEAGWADNTVDEIIGNVKNVKKNVNDLLKTITDAKDTITDVKIKNLIADMKKMLQDAVNTQQEGVAAFLGGGSCTTDDGTPCGNFRGDLLYVIQALEDLSNKLLGFHNFPNLLLAISKYSLFNS